MFLSFETKEKVKEEGVLLLKDIKGLLKSLKVGLTPEEIDIVIN